MPKTKPSEADILMRRHLDEVAPRCWTHEWTFTEDRKWRFDYAIPHWKIGVEIEGGAFIQGRHTRGAGFIKDMEKYNHATLLGWRILRFTPDQVLRGEAIAFIKRVLDATGPHRGEPGAAGEALNSD